MENDKLDFLANQRGQDSNWPDLDGCRDRRTIDHYVVDVDGITVCTGKDVSSVAKDYKRAGRKVQVRKVYLTETEFRQEDEIRRERLWQDQLYKP